MERVADEKKPEEHGTEETSAQDEAKAPETEVDADEVKDAVSDGTGPEAKDDTPLPKNEDDDAEPTEEEAQAEAEVPEGADTLSGESPSVGPWGTNAAPEDTAAADTLSGGDGDDTLESEDRIYSVGEAEEAAATGHSTEEPEPERHRDEPEETEAAPAPVPVVQEKVIERRGGFFPTLIGGIVAAALGYGAAAYTGGTWPFDARDGSDFEAETRGALADQSSRLEALSGRIEEVSGQVSDIDLSSFEGSIGDLGGTLETVTGDIDTLKQTVSDLDGRIAALEKRPVAEAVSPEAIAAYERELEEVREAIQTQRVEVEKMTQDALEAEANAEEQAGIAQARSALSDVNAALVSGEPYSAELDVLETNGISVPEALSAPAADGVSTMAALTEAFPPLARDALAASRRAEAEGESGGARLTTFLANQLGARSVEPKDGAGTDAVLSRAEAALRGGDLGTALSELETLPEEAAAELSGWLDQARTRQEALAAADQVAQELNKE